MKLIFSDAQRHSYLKYGVRSVKGWLGTADKFLIWSLCEIQTDDNAAGSVGEFGVDQGKLFILLYLNLHEGESAFCVDAFDELTAIVGSPSDEKAFLGNIDRFANRTMLRVIRSNSLDVTKRDITEIAGSPRLISIFGAHTKEITNNDLILCESVLSDRGVTIVDGYFSPHWPGVSEGVIAYFEEDRRALVPFAIGMTKVFFCRPDFQLHYRDKLKAYCPEIFQTSREFLGQDVDVYRGYDSLAAILKYSRLQTLSRVALRMDRLNHKARNWISNQVRF